MMLNSPLPPRNAVAEKPKRAPFHTGGKGIRQVPGSEKDMFQCRAVLRWQPPMQSLASFGLQLQKKKTKVQAAKYVRNLGRTDRSKPNDWTVVVFATTAL
jgi:hypothetical protein